MSIRIENCIQHPVFKDKYKKIPRTVNLLVSDNQDNSEFDWEEYKSRYDRTVNSIRSNAKWSQEEKEKRLKKIKEVFDEVSKSRKRFVVGEDVFFNEDGMPYDKKALRENVFALHMLGQYYYVVKYLEPKDREMKILQHFKDHNIQIQNLIPFDMKYAVEKEKKALKKMANSLKTSQPIVTTKGFYIPVVMPYYDGDLMDFLATRSSNYKRKLESEEILDVLLTVSNVYSELMNHNLFYTDIKPGNIFYREQNGKINVVVGDLGGMVYLPHNVKCDFAPQTFPYPHEKYQMIDIYNNYKVKRNACKDNKEVEQLNELYKKQINNYFHTHHSPVGDINYGAREWEFRQRMKMENIVTWGVGVLGMTLFMTHERDYRQFVENVREPTIIEQSARFTQNLEYKSLSYSNPDFYKYRNGLKSIPGYLQFRQQLPSSLVFRTMIPQIVKDIFYLKIGDMEATLKGLNMEIERRRRNNRRYDDRRYDDRRIRRYDDRRYDDRRVIRRYRLYDDRRNDRFDDRRKDDRNNGGNNDDGQRKGKRRRWKPSVSPSEQAKREARRQRFKGGGLVLRKGKIQLK